MKIFKTFIQNIFLNFGYKLTKYNKNNNYNGFDIDYNFLHSDFNEYHKEVIKLVKDYTMTSPERLYTLIESVKYLTLNNIEGDIVECGVWRGGSMMAIAKTLLENNNESKNLFLFDTYDGMTPPDKNKDIDTNNLSALNYMQTNIKNSEDFIWAYASLNQVINNMESIKYPKDKIHYIIGKVEETLPIDKITKISLLRLDTDWYESTKHELTYLFPLISKGGVIIIDDYGHWQGARQAVDEYLVENNIKILLNRVDYSCRIGIKQ